ncbi:MAG: phosphoribosylanthranilate isomerase [Dehalococcoidia bacterium]|nr:MAG: phosphoribosylanthranilate isomerase [Dehalococcoidia bacterium]
MTRVKVCGIKEEAHARAVARAGGDFIGLVFAPSGRQITPERARDIASVVRENNKIAVVGVFVNTPAAEVNRIADYCHLDWVQLSGDEPWEHCRQIARPVIKAVWIGWESPEEIVAHLTKGEKALSGKKHLYLVDSCVKGKYGGSGVAFDWGRAQPVAEHFPVIIAGGLNAHNVAQAIRIVSPWGVDVSSGVEVDGVKDEAKIKAFIEAVRRSDDRQ